MINSNFKASLYISILIFTLKDQSTNFNTDLENMNLEFHIEKSIPTLPYSFGNHGPKVVVSDHHMASMYVKCDWICKNLPSTQSHESLKIFTSISLCLN